ncbi:hypothetical protein [Streptomyces sp. NPDC059639]
MLEGDVDSFVVRNQCGDRVTEVALDPVSAEQIFALLEPSLADCAVRVAA